MNEEKKREIERLAEDAHDKWMRYELLGAMNTPKEPKSRKSASIEYELARREMIESRRELEDALNS